MKRGTIAVRRRFSALEGGTSGFRHPWWGVEGDRRRPPGVLSRIRWANLARLVALLAATALIVSGPGLGERSEEPPARGAFEGYLVPREAAPVERTPGGVPAGPRRKSRDSMGRGDRERRSARHGAGVRLGAGSRRATRKRPERKRSPRAAAVPAPAPAPVPVPAPSPLLSPSPPQPPPAPPAAGQFTPDP